MGNVQVSGKLFRAALADALRVRDRGALVRLRLVCHRHGRSQDRYSAYYCKEVSAVNKVVEFHGALSFLHPYEHAQKFF